MKEKLSNPPTCDELIVFCKENGLNSMYLYRKFIKANPMLNLPKDPDRHFAKEGFFWKCEFVDKHFRLSVYLHGRNFKKIRIWREERMYDSLAKVLEACKLLKIKNLVDYLSSLHTPLRSDKFLPNCDEIIKLNDFKGWKDFSLKLKSIE